MPYMWMFYLLLEILVSVKVFPTGSMYIYDYIWSYIGTSAIPFRRNSCLLFGMMSLGFNFCCWRRCWSRFYPLPKMEHLLPSISVWLKVAFVDCIFIDKDVYRFDMLDHLDLDISIDDICEPRTQLTSFLGCWPSNLCVKCFRIWVIWVLGICGVCRSNWMHSKQFQWSIRPFDIPIPWFEVPWVQ